MKLRIDNFYRLRNKILKFQGRDENNLLLFRSYVRSQFGGDWLDAGYFSLPPPLAPQLKPTLPPQ